MSTEKDTKRNGANVLLSVTILAFVYVPLNTVTSIYSMNIKQMNGSGQNLTSFVVTAILALFVTGSVWLVAEWIHEVDAWHKIEIERRHLQKNRQPPFSPSATFSSGVRFYLTL